MKIWPKEVEALIVRRRPPNGAQWLDPNWYELLRVVDPAGRTSLLLYARGQYGSPEEALRHKRIAYTDWAPLNSAPMYLHEGTFYFWKPPYQRDLLDDIDQGMEEAVEVMGPIAGRVIGTFLLLIGVSWFMDEVLAEWGGLGELLAAILLVSTLWLGACVGWPGRHPVWPWIRRE